MLFRFLKVIGEVEDDQRPVLEENGDYVVSINDCLDELTLSWMIFVGVCIVSCTLKRTTDVTVTRKTHVGRFFDRQI